jgi:hypothetical protein
MAFHSCALGHQRLLVPRTSFESVSTEHAEEGWSGEIQDQPGDQAGYDDHVERPVAQDLVGDLKPVAGCSLTNDRARHLV